MNQRRDSFKSDESDPGDIDRPRNNRDRQRDRREEKKQPEEEEEEVGFTLADYEAQKQHAIWDAPKKLLKNQKANQKNKKRNRIPTVAQLPSTATMHYLPQRP